MLISSEWMLWVSIPKDIKSTPVFATVLILSKLILPEASVAHLLLIISTAFFIVSILILSNIIISALAANASVSGKIKS